MAGVNGLAPANSRRASPANSRRAFDPTVDLPGDLTAICLSFVGVRTLLVSAQRVNRAWRDAINGGLPAVWRDVQLDDPAAMMPQVVQKSHGGIRSLRIVSVTLTSAVNHIRSFSTLRVLDIGIPLRAECTISPVLPSLLLLEDLSVRNSRGIIFPPLQFLKSVRVNACKMVQGLHNLHALTKLDVRTCSVDNEGAWPTSLREVSIFTHPVQARNPRIVERIAALQHLVLLATDWSFAAVDFSFNTVFIPPYDQLSFLPGFTSLQQLAVRFSYNNPLQQAVFNQLGAMTFLRELKLEEVVQTGQCMQCLAQLTNLHSLTLSDLHTLTTEGIRHVSALPNLTRLAINVCVSINDYSFVGLCTQLRELKLFHRHHQLSLAEVLAISRLQHVTKLDLAAQLANPALFSHFLTMCSLRHLHMWYWDDSDNPASPAAFSSLPNLTRLESISIFPIEKDSISKMVDYLVQMPTLRSIALPTKLGVEDTARLRAALPRLETIARFC